MINRIAVSFFAAGLALAASAQELPQPSPLCSVEQVVGLTKMKVTYSRPSVKGRVIFGGLVPYGEVWRTGANMATRIELSGPVMMQGTELPAGTYAIFTRPNEGEWTVMFNKEADQSGTSKYDKAKDVVQVTVPVEKGERTETFTIGFANLSGPTADLELRWEDIVVRVPMKADPTEQGLLNIKTALSEGKMDASGYNRIARFYLDLGESKQAITYADRSVEMEEHYWNSFTLALARKAVGDDAGALKSAERARQLATEEHDQAMIDQIDAKLKEWAQK